MGGYLFLDWAARDSLISLLSLSTFFPCCVFVVLLLLLCSCSGGRLRATACNDLPYKASQKAPPPPPCRRWGPRCHCIAVDNFSISQFPTRALLFLYSFLFLLLLSLFFSFLFSFFMALFTLIRQRRFIFFFTLKKSRTGLVCGRGIYLFIYKI